MKYTIVLITALLLTGCSAMDAAGKAVGAAFGTNDSGLTVDTELQNGDKTVNVGENDNSKTNVDDNKGVVNISSKKSDKSFDNTKTVTVNEGPGLVYTLLFALGWLCPSHTEIWREVKSWFSPKI